AWITAQQATDPDYWVQQLSRTVRFAPALRELLENPQRIFLEVGPGNALARIVNSNNTTKHSATALSSMPSSPQPEAESTFLLTAAGRLWISGGLADWELFHAGEGCRRVSLPTYPFEKKRYWIDPRPIGEGPAQFLSHGKTAKVENWFYLPSWRATVLTEEQVGADTPLWVLLADDRELADSMRHLLDRQARPAVVIHSGADFEQRSEREFVIDPANSRHYDALLEAIPPAPVYKMVHLWSLTPEQSAETGQELFRSLQTRGYYSLLALSQALHRVAATAEILVVSDRLHDIDNVNAAYPEKQPLLALCQVVPQEAPNIAFRCMELDPSWHSRSRPESASRIVEEAASASKDPIVAYRGARRLVRSFDPAPLGPHSKAVRKLRQRGTYLITGGFGGVGMFVAEHLARCFAARLVLASRTALPSRDLWPEYLKTAADDPASARIRQVQNLEALGADVLTVSFDVTDASQIGAALEQAELAFGEIHGVFHAAGVTSGDSLFKSFTELGVAESEVQFQPKVYGVYALQQALAPRKPDFCLLFSSNAAILGGLGYLTYAAANRFMDGFSHHASRDGIAWISANWDPWPKEFKKSRELKTAVDQYAMTPEESLQALTKTIEHAPAGQLVIATGDLDKRLSIWSGQSENHATAQGRFVRPDLAVDYAPPSGEIEQALAAIWQRILGIERIGRNDNFFDLGGHSLLATRVISQLRDEFQCEVPINKFFEAPTISEVAALIQSLKSGSEDSERDAILALLAELSDEEVGLELQKREAM
ncbi:MAG: SDR family NAD(P)-dependent oxidoreductase, partial [Acidobacteriaceae bacterium]|nr:SDR family NAD(P)-dependent oxidoreductase [Acidobacteriaceae bacterium]